VLEPLDDVERRVAIEGWLLLSFLTLKIDSSTLLTNDKHLIMNGYCVQIFLNN
jgi:hypothetical protein